MKSQQFATNNFIGLESLQKEFRRSSFSFREHKTTIYQILNGILRDFEKMMKNFESDQ